MRARQFPTLFGGYVTLTKCGIFWKLTLNSYDKLEKVRGQQCVSHGTCLPVKGVTAAMMDVVVRKSRAIRSIYEQDRALFLESEQGLIRI